MSVVGLNFIPLLVNIFHLQCRLSVDISFFFRCRFFLVLSVVSNLFINVTYSKTVKH